MSVETVLERGRQVRKKLMRSRVRITRPGNSVFDPATGTVTLGDTVIYEGPCHFKSWSGVGQRIANSAERELISTQYDVVLPWDNDAAQVSVSDTATITATGDEWVIGRTLVVNSVEFANDRTARHITVNDQDAGEVTYG